VDRDGVALRAGPDLGAVFPPARAGGRLVVPVAELRTPAVAPLATPRGGFPAGGRFLSVLVVWFFVVGRA